MRQVVVSKYTPADSCAINLGTFRKRGVGKGWKGPNLLLIEALAKAFWQRGNSIIDTVVVHLANFWNTYRRS